MSDIPQNENPGDDASDEDFSNKVQAYYKALEEEFSVEHNPELADPEELAEKTRKKITENLPKAITSIANLAQHADSESVRFQASKYIVEAAIGSKAFAPPLDPLTDLLQKIQAND